MKKNILILAALLGAFIWTGCQTLDNEQTISERQPQSGSFILTVNAVKGADTKALALVGGNTLTPYWDGNEIVKVYKKGSNDPIGTMTTVTPQGEGTSATTAKLSGTISGTLENGDELTLIIFPGTTWNYSGQTGSSASLAGYDYATASVTVKGIVDVTGGKQVTTTADATFVNEQSVWRFGFKAGETTINVKSFSVASDHGKLAQTRSWDGNSWTSTYGTLSVTPAAATNQPLYLAVRNENAETSENDLLSFYVFRDDDKALYTGTQTLSGGKLGNGKFLSALAVSVTKSNLAQSGSVSEVW